MFLPHPRVKVSTVGSLRDREVACSASDRQGSNFESCVWRTVSSQSSHHPQEVLLAQFSLYVHKGGLKPDLFQFCFINFINFINFIHSIYFIPSFISFIHSRIHSNFNHAIYHRPTKLLACGIPQGMLMPTTASLKRNNRIYWINFLSCAWRVEYYVFCRNPALSIMYPLFSRICERSNTRRWANVGPILDGVDPELNQWHLCFPVTWEYPPSTYTVLVLSMRDCTLSNTLVSTRHWSSDGSILGHRLRSWPSIEPAQEQCFLLKGTRNALIESVEIRVMDRHGTKDNLRIWQYDLFINPELCCGSWIFVCLDPVHVFAERDHI